MRKKEKENKTPMKNITINLPYCFEINLQKLIDNKIISSRSQAIRTALRDFLREEYEVNLEILGYGPYNNNNNGGVGSNA